MRTSRTFLTPGGLRLRADVLPGAGPPPVLLVHGAGQTRATWAETAGALAAEGWPAISLDLRGHGESDWSPDGDYTLDAYASDLRAVAAALESPPLLVGASLGGLGALLAVAEAPRLAVAGLVLVDAAHRFEVGGARRIADVLAGDGIGAEHPDEVTGSGARRPDDRDGPDGQDGARVGQRPRDGRRQGRWDPEVLTGVRHLLGSGPAAERRAGLAARALSAPTLLIRGGWSDVVTRDTAEEFARLAPVTRVTEVHGGGHMLVGDRNGEVTDAVIRFLRSLAGTVPARGA
jgi:pimeloyl-ACP methyl ester carboxylesterase